jgi:hypothetical protein
MPDIAAQIETALAVMRLFDEIKSLLPEGVPIRSANGSVANLCALPCHAYDPGWLGSRSPDGDRFQRQSF